MKLTSIRSPLRPTRAHVGSRAWAFYVNGLAASPLVTRSTRSVILRRFGLDVETELIYPGCYFHTADVRLERGVILNHGVHIENVARVEIGTQTGLGVHSLVLTSSHDVGPRTKRYGAWRRLPVTIGSGCWIGARAIILPGVTIGDGCIVGAGSVVREDCEPDGFYAGVPARRLRDVEPR